MGMPAARVTDFHACPMATPGTPPIPHVGGPILPPAAITVLTGKLCQARVGDMAQCVGPPDVIVMGSMSVFVCGQPAARMFDPTAHGGKIMKGEPTVLIGDGGGGGGAGGKGAVANAELSDAFAKAMAWAVDGIKSLLAEVLPSEESYGTAIKIGGDKAFQDKVRADLDAIAKTPSGKMLLADLERSGRTVTIEPTTSGNSCSHDSDGLKNADGTFGKGSDSTVAYNPDRKKIGDRPWETRPPAIGLAHELIHAQHAAEGSMDLTEVSNDSRPDPANPKALSQVPQEEVRTAGIPPQNKDVYNENTFRAEWDPPQQSRIWY